MVTVGGGPPNGCTVSACTVFAGPNNAPAAREPALRAVPGCASACASARAEPSQLLNEHAASQPALAAGQHSPAAAAFRRRQREYSTRAAEAWRGDERRRDE